MIIIKTLKKNCFIISFVIILIILYTIIHCVNLKKKTYFFQKQYLYKIIVYLYKILYYN